MHPYEIMIPLRCPKIQNFFAVKKDNNIKYSKFVTKIVILSVEMTWSGQKTNIAGWSTKFFFGEGPTCSTDVNECARFVGTNLGCQNGAQCQNQPGTYTWVLLASLLILR